MAETTSEVRADIEQTRARMSGAIAELERKVDVAEKVRNHPWAAVGVAFGAGIALSASRVDVRAARVTADATKETGSKLGGALDGVVAALIAESRRRFSRESMEQFARWCRPSRAAPTTETQHGVRSDRSRLEPRNR